MYDKRLFRVFSLKSSFIQAWKTQENPNQKTAENPLEALNKKLQRLKQDWETMKIKVDGVSHGITESREEEREIYKLKEELTQKIEDMELRLTELMSQIGEAQKNEIENIKLEIGTLKNEINPWPSESDRHEFLTRIIAKEVEINSLKKLTGKSKEAVNDVLKKWIDNLSAGDIYMIKQEWIDLAEVFLLVSKNGTKASKEMMQVGDEFIVNFWKNSVINDTIGAWDLLPINKFSRVRITTNEGELIKWVRGYIPRPWYYELDNNWKETWDYIPVYDGYKIEILEENEMQWEEKTNLNQSAFNRYKKFRNLDFMDMVVSWWNETEMKSSYKSKSDIEILVSFLLSLFWWDIVFENGKIKTKNGKTFSEIFQKNIQFDTRYNSGYGWKGGPFISMSDAEADGIKWKDSYWCAYIARMNAKRLFGLTLTSGDADVAMKNYQDQGLSHKGEITNLDFIQQDNGADFVDLYYTWKSWIGKKLEKRGGAGHRVVGYKWEWEWFVLDAYANNGKPIPLIEYAQVSWRSLVKGYLQDSPNITKEQANEAAIITRTKLEKTPEFMAKLNEVCDNLGCSVADMLIVMDAESGISTTARNPKSRARGLIQFMPDTARGLGTSVEALAQMSWVEQLDYVEKYFRPYRWKLHTVYDLYLATFHPASLGKPKNTRIGVDIGKWTDNNPDYKKIYNQNPAIAKFAWGKGYITVGDFYAYVQAKKIDALELRSAKNT